VGREEQEPTENPQETTFSCCREDAGNGRRVIVGEDRMMGMRAGGRAVAHPGLVQEGNWSRQSSSGQGRRSECPEKPQA
jgi:hypothetical protein